MIRGCYQIGKALGLFNTNNAKSVHEEVMIGESIENKDNVAFCVNNIVDEKSIGEGSFKRETENNFVVITVKVTNNSNKVYDVNSLRFLLTDGKNEYQYFTDALMAVDDHMYMDSINPGISREYKLVYETPSDSAETDYKLKILPVGFDKKDYVLISLKQK